MRCSFEIRIYCTIVLDADKKETYKNTKGIGRKVFNHKYEKLSFFKDFYKHFSAFLVNELPPGQFRAVSTVN